MRMQLSKEGCLKMQTGGGVKHPEILQKSYVHGPKGRKGGRWEGRKLGKLYFSHLDDWMDLFPAWK